MANKTFLEIDRIATRQNDDLFVFHRGGQEYTQTRENLAGYDFYVGMATQSGTDAPDVTVMNSTTLNYIGDIVWTRTDVGDYTGTLSGAFTAAKTDCSIQLTPDALGSEAYMTRTGDDTVRLITSTGGVLADSILQKATIKIFVYA